MFGLSTLDEAVGFASQMAKANLLPAHLKGSPADCLRVVMQAARWQMDPFSVADKTSVISGKLMYEGQLVSAVVNARGNLSKRLDYRFEGEGEKRILTVTGTLKGETESREITLDVPMAKRINKNGQMNQNPDQQMCYIGARMWARRHTSELMLGVYTPDEVDPNDNPEQPENVTPIADRPAPKPRKGAAGAKNQPAEVVVEQEPAEVKPVENIQEAMQAREEKVAKSEPVKEVEPVKPTPRVFLKEGERLNAMVKLDSITPVFMTVDGVRKACFKANVSGEFVGEVRSAIGTTQTGEKTMTINPPFVAGAKVAVVLLGKMSAAPAGNPLHGKVLVWVEALQQEEENA